MTLSDSASAAKRVGIGDLIFAVVSRPKGRERLHLGTARIARCNRQQPAFAFAADENETILNAALGLPSIGRKASDSGRHSSAEVRGRLEPLDVNNLVLHIAEHNIGSVCTISCVGDHPVSSVEDHLIS
jgi:hypothetical protein